MGTRSRISGAVRGLRRQSAGSAPPWPAHTGFSNDAAGFASCCGPASCHPLNEVSLLRFDTGISPDAGSRATGNPGVSPDRTSTGWLP